MYDIKILLRLFSIMVFCIGITIAGANRVFAEKTILTAEESVIKLAEIILVNVYGKKVLEQRPFKAKLEGDIWKVNGTLYCQQDVVCKGGVARIEIYKKDGKVKSVIHDK